MDGDLLRRVTIRRWISTEGVTYGTSLPKPSRFSLQFQDRKLEKEFVAKANGNSTFYCVFLLGLLNATFCIQTVLFRFLMQPRVYAQVAFSFISPIVICSVEIAVLLLCSRSFVKRWQHLLLIPGLTFTAGTMFIYLPYFTDVAEYRAGPVAFAYAFLYMIIFGVSLVPNSFYSALITLVPLGPTCWLLVSYRMRESPIIRLSTLSLYGTATIVTLFHMRERESRQRRIFALQKDILIQSQHPINVGELTSFLPILGKPDLPRGLHTQVSPCSSKTIGPAAQDFDDDANAEEKALKTAIKQWILWDFEGILMTLNWNNIKILNAYFFRIVLSHMSGTFNSDWTQCGVEGKYSGWLCRSFLVNFRTRYAFLFVAELIFAFTDQLVCSEESNKMYLLCTRGELLRNFRIGLAILPLTGIFVSFYKPINLDLNKLRLANLAIEVPRSLGFLLIWSSMSWMNPDDGSAEIFACYLISLLLEACSLHPMKLQHFTVLHTVTMLQALTILFVVRRSILIDNIFLFSSLGVIGVLECFLNDKDMRKLYILEQIIEARIDATSKSNAGQEPAAASVETMA